MTTTKLPMLTTRTLDPAMKRHHDDDKLDMLVDNVGMVSVYGPNDPRYNTSASAAGISFAKVVYLLSKEPKILTPPETREG